MSDKIDLYQVGRLAGWNNTELAKTSPEAASFGNATGAGILKGADDYRQGWTDGVELNESGFSAMGLDLREGGR